MKYRKTKRPMAFARATGDDIFNAIIWDMVVDPSFQQLGLGLGLGKAVMEKLVEELVAKEICNVRKSQQEVEISEVGLVGKGMVLRILGWRSLLEGREELGQ
ncbi:hypothetical protein ACE6H2_023904 [Prunus campanulata]